MRISMEQMPSGRLEINVHREMRVSASALNRSIVVRFEDGAGMVCAFLDDLITARELYNQLGEAIKKLEGGAA